MDHVHSSRSQVFESAESANGVRTPRIELRICSWNMAGQAISPKDDVGEWLAPRDSPLADIYVVGIQEVIPLGAMAAVRFGTEETKRLNQLEVFVAGTLVQRSAEKGNAVLYRKITSFTLVGLALLVYVRADMLDVLLEVAKDQVKCGLGGYSGTKGGIGVRFGIGPIKCCFMNTHLAAGHDSFQYRERDINTIFKNMFRSKADKTDLSDFDLVVLFGDLNIRLDIDGTRKYLDAPNEDLLTRDQLLNGMIPSLLDFNEGIINFPPTYKYIIGTGSFCPKRQPAWCDRILFKTTEDAKCEVKGYTSYHGIKHTSDHRPIASRLVLKVDTEEYSLHSESHQTIRNAARERMGNVVSTTPKNRKLKTNTAPPPTSSMRSTRSVKSIGSVKSTRSKRSAVSEINDWGPSPASSDNWDFIRANSEKSTPSKIQRSMTNTTLDSVAAGRKAGLESMMRSITFKRQNTMGNGERNQEKTKSGTSDPDADEPEPSTFQQAIDSHKAENMVFLEADHKNNLNHCSDIQYSQGADSNRKLRSSSSTFKSHQKTLQTEQESPERNTSNDSKGTSGTNQTSPEDAPWRGMYDSTNSLRRVCSLETKFTETEYAELKVNKTKSNASSSSSQAWVVCLNSDGWGKDDGSLQSVPHGRNARGSHADWLEPTTPPTSRKGRGSSKGSPSSNSHSGTGDGGYGDAPSDRTAGNKKRGSLLSRSSEAPNLESAIHEKMKPATRFSKKKVNYSEAPPVASIKSARKVEQMGADTTSGPSKTKKNKAKNVVGGQQEKPKDQLDTQSSNTMSIRSQGGQGTKAKAKPSKKQEDKPVQKAKSKNFVNKATDQPVGAETVKPVQSETVKVGTVSLVKSEIDQATKEVETATLVKSEIDQAASPADNVFHVDSRPSVFFMDKKKNKQSSNPSPTVEVETNVNHDSPEVETVSLVKSEIDQATEEAASPAENEFHVDSRPSVFFMDKKKKKQSPNPSPTVETVNVVKGEIDLATEEAASPVENAIHVDSRPSVFFMDKKKKRRPSNPAPTVELETIIEMQTGETKVDAPWMNNVMSHKAQLAVNKEKSTLKFGQTRATAGRQKSNPAQDQTQAAAINKSDQTIGKVRSTATCKSNLTLGKAYSTVTSKSTRTATSSESQNPALAKAKHLRKTPGPKKGGKPEAEVEHDNTNGVQKAKSGKMPKAKSKTTLGSNKKRLSITEQDPLLECAGEVVRETSSGDSETDSVRVRRNSWLMEVKPPQDRQHDENSASNNTQESNASTRTESTDLSHLTPSRSAEIGDPMANSDVHEVVRAAVSNARPLAHDPAVDDKVSTKKQTVVSTHSIRMTANRSAKVVPNGNNTRLKHEDMDESVETRKSERVAATRSRISVISYAVRH